MLKNHHSIFKSTKLISLDKYFDEMIKLYDSESFPKVLLLSGKKGIGKFTLVFHFINYIYSKKEKTNYNIKDKLINESSIFYKSIIKQTCTDVIFVEVEDGKNIKIDDIRNLKSILSTSSLSENPRFIIIDEIEFLNISSVNALLKTLEEPSKNNYFILIDNQQTNLIETISSRCLKSNIYLNSNQRKKIINYFNESKKITLPLDNVDNLTPGVLIAYNEISNKYKLDESDNIYSKLNKLLYGYKKDKNIALINMSIFLIDKLFYHLVESDTNKIDFLLNLKSSIVKSINDFIIYNLNINSVLNSIETKLKNVT